MSDSFRVPVRPPEHKCLPERRRGAAAACGSAAGTGAARTRRFESDEAEDSTSEEIPPGLGCEGVVHVHLRHEWGYKGGSLK